jgi:ubiquinone/menaquinone biosynthesis C-methylase UbiE
MSLNSILEALRRLARRHLLTANTIRYRIEYRAIRGLINETGDPVDVIVDLGAGSGEMSARLVEDGLAGTVIGVEPDPTNFSLLERRYSKLKGSQCINRPLEETRLNDSAVAAILSTQVLEHIPDDDAAVAEIYRILKPGGLAVISVPHPPELFPNPGHVRPGYTLDTLTTLFERHGFALVDYDYFLTLPTVRRTIASEELGVLGRLLSPSWADRETHLTRSEKETLQPYGLAALFRKQPPSPLRS